MAIGAYFIGGILFMAIGAYFIHDYFNIGYWCLFYWWILVVINCYYISGYFVIEYGWLLMVVILVDILLLNMGDY